MADDANIYIRLGDAAKVSAGYPLRGAADALEPGSTHLIQLKNTNPDDDIDWAGVSAVTLPSKRVPSWLTDDDVLFAARGTRTLAYPLSNVPPKTVCAPQFFVLSVQKPEALSPHFLAWQINQKPAQDYFQRNATGSYIQNIRRSVLEDLTIAVPPKDKQMMVVAFWKAAQRERAVLTQLIENRNSQLEALALGLAPKNPEA
ncbi:hypothetical protein [Oricola indica]|uniref:hypothetical protein n=1 Tax=Oricola indica TaxID=2872591 RepID=UPI001CBD72F2|nr:hypothetical protein [Oricola indica]